MPVPRVASNICILQAKRIVAAHKNGTLYKNKERLLIRAASVDLGLMSDGKPLRWKPSCSLKQTAKLLGMPKSSLIRTLQKPLSEYADEHQNRTRHSVSKFPELDAHIYRWFMGQRALGNPVSNAMLTEQARQLAAAHGVPASQFTATDSWLRAWRVRWTVSGNKRTHGKAGQVDVNSPTIKRNVANIRKFIADKRILPGDVYNTDETGLFFRATPQCTMHSLRDVASSDLRGGKLDAKDRLTLLLAVNSTGTHKLPITVIGLSKNPRCFGKNGARCPCFYMNQRKSWCDGPRFKEWLLKLFLPQIRARHRRQVALVMDNCGGHTVKELEFTQAFYVHVLLLSQNCTSVLQPLDAGIISHSTVVAVSAPADQTAFSFPQPANARARPPQERGQEEATRHLRSRPWVQGSCT